MDETAPQRRHDPREVVSGLRFIARGGGWQSAPSAWAGRFRRVARADERLATTLAGFHSVSFALLAL